MYQGNKNSRSSSKSPRAIAMLLLALLFLASLAPIAVAAPQLSARRTEICAVQTVEPEHILARAARQLGWSERTSPRPDLPGDTFQVMGGNAEQPSMWAVVSVMHHAEEPTLLELLEIQGLAHGVFHGHEAIIVHPGERICQTVAAPASANAASALTSSQPSAPRLPLCSDSTRGLVAWRCGRYVFSAEDATGRGQELAIAEALYAAAEEQNLCKMSTVVILAETRDAPGRAHLARFRALAQASNRYYALNAYGRVSFDFTFLDADGPLGGHDWYNVGFSLDSFPDGHAFGVAALAKAFADARLSGRVYLERAIVVYPGVSRQWDASRPMSSNTAWFSPDHSVLIRGPGYETCLYVPNLILVSEEDELGTWVHELGHTLYARYRTEGYERVSDRYDCGQGEDRLGHLGYWDLMASGSHWGNPDSTSPTHMSSYTKVAATWLRYTPASFDQDYVLTALENQRVGDAVLTVDDPLSSDPLCLYIIEARDSAVHFGAPECGVMIYHVTFNRAAGHPVVEIVSAGGDSGNTVGRRPPAQHPTLRGAGDPGGVTEYVNAPDGFRVRLLSESFSPYKATIRIERYGRDRVPGVAPYGAPSTSSVTTPRPH